MKFWFEHFEQHFLKSHDSSWFWFTATPRLRLINDALNIARTSGLNSENAGDCCWSSQGHQRKTCTAGRWESLPTVPCDGLPFGNLTLAYMSYWKWPFVVNFPINGDVHWFSIVIIRGYRAGPDEELVLGDFASAPRAMRELGTIFMVI